MLVTILMMGRVSLISSTFIHLLLQTCFILTLGKSFNFFETYYFHSSKKQTSRPHRDFALKLVLFSIPAALQATK